MRGSCTLQLHAHGVWHDVASVSLHGPENEGWKTKTYCGYAVEWAFEHAASIDAHALCANWPVGLEALQLPHWPVFLIDMLPHGFGRQELLRRIGQAPTAGVAVDWQLLLAGAGNPIGNLRVKEAAAWLEKNDGAQKGFTGRCQLSWPPGDNYGGRLEAGNDFVVMDGQRVFRAAGASPCCAARRL